MVIQAACPDPDVIRDLLNGSLPDAEQSELSSHFDLCSTCQQTFDAEAGGPQFLGDVARLCGDAGWQQNTPTLDRLLRDIPQQLSDAADEATVATWSTEAVADFLDASENADHIGRLGTYEIVEVIGRGGMGIVLRGIDSRLNRVVAIKVLAPELASNPNARRRFYREGQAAAAVSHDHVVTIHAVDDHERLPYLVMEFVAGESLEECIRRTGPLPLESILRMGRQAALGLAAAHEVGLVHRDMKPANILLENGIQRVRITDFGLARATDDVSMTQTGTVSGTPLYMSPEQAGGEAVDHRSDLFSLGSVFYAMCTGRPAFRAQTTLAVIKRVCEDTPRPIREVNPDIPQWLVDIIDRLMAKQPDDRIQSAAELAELLGNHLAHLQDPDNVPAPAGAESEPTSKQRTLKSLLLAVLLIGGVGLGITEAAGVTEVGKFLGIVLRLKTPEGTLVIEIEDPDVEVSVDGSEVVLNGITKKELRLKPGKYQYRATRNGEPAKSEWVTIERDGRTVVRIRQLPTEIVGVAAEGERLRSATKLSSNLDTGRYEQTTVETSGTEPATRTVGDGIRLLSPVRVRRMVPDQLAPVWFGKWYFKQIPEQLYGQNFAFVSRDGGLLEFDVTEVNDRKLTQRIWLLIPHQDWDGSQTTSIPEDIDPSLKFATRESLLAFGWSAWNDISSEHIRVTPDQPEHHMQWSVFYRDAKPGEKYRVRTHWKHTPMLVWGSTQLDHVIVEPEWDQRVAVFGPDVTLPHGDGDLVFEHAPEAVHGRLFTKRNAYQGAARFRVQSDQKVMVAMYEWGHEHEGNASGNWMPELTSRRKMAEQGWQEAGEVASRHSDLKQPDVNWFLYTRDCTAGESFVLRNHKYQAPLVFSEQTYFEAGPIDVDPPALEKLARRQAEERLAMLVEQFNSMFKQERYAEAFVIARQTKREFPKSPVADLMLGKSQAVQRVANPESATAPESATDPSAGSVDPMGSAQGSATNVVRPDAIRLDGSSLRTQLASEVGEPAVFGTHGAGVENVKLPGLFLSRQTETPIDGWIARDGYGLLLGQIPLTAHPDDRFELERFERTGNQLRVVFRQHTTNPAFSAVTNQSGAFRDLSAEQSLIATLRRTEARIAELLSDGKRERLIASPLSKDFANSEPALGTLLLSRVLDRRHFSDLVQAVAPLDAARTVSPQSVEQARHALQEELKWFTTRLQHARSSKAVNQDQLIREAEIGVIQTAYRLALCTREEALTHPANSRQYEFLMRQAAVEFEEIYQKHRSQFVGVLARLWYAACLCDVREFELASSICKEVLDLPATTPNISTLNGRAMHFFLIAMIDGRLDDPKNAVELAGKWLSTADSVKRRSDSAACIMWEQARAMYIGSLPEDSNLPHPTASPPDVNSELVGSLRKKIRGLLKWPGISAGPFKEHAAALKTLLDEEYPEADAVAENVEPKQSLFFGTPLPTLPPGDYELTAEVRTSPRPVARTVEEKLSDHLRRPSTLPGFETTTAITGRLTVPGADQDAAEFKRLAVLAIVTKPAENETFGHAVSSPLDIDISELITRSGQLQAVLNLPKDLEALRVFLDEQLRAGNKWAMCAALDIENPDSKIVAAKALRKLADPDTAAVLLIAAKRNAYIVFGNENAALHSIFQAELKRALEAATGLTLSKVGLTIEIPALGPPTGETVDEITDFFLAGTDFAKVDTWLRNVYLADVASALAPVEETDPTATPAAGGIPIPHTSHLGLIGRLAMRIVSSSSPGQPSNQTQFDPGYIFQYVPGQFFHRDVLPLALIEDHHFVVTLSGQLVVPRDMIVDIWHAGGGVSHDQCSLYVDDRLLGVVGDNRDKHNIYEVPLLKGRHDIRWELTGGTFRTNILVIQDRETGQRLEIVNPGPESLRQTTEDKVVRIQSSRTDWPVSAKANWLPKSVVTTETDPAATGVGQ